MKRFLSIVLALCLMLCTCAIACAESATTLSWEDTSVQELREKLGMDGTTYTLNAYPVKYWVPENLHDAELTQDEIDQGVKVKYATEDGTCFFVVLYGDSSTYNDAHDVAETIRQNSEFTDVAEVVVNGLGAVSYKAADGSRMHLVLSLPDTQLLVVTFYCIDTEASLTESAVIGASFRQAEAAN